uniref:uncharacterized protein LOC122591669 n=1 Tax=Erigeron canadensis TaxID=72917 RepID=UPI001CB8E6E1|nr:uncharacterized protein LOC122591669 [Erigeron canadensis]
MNFLSLNIRGTKVSGKASWVQKLNLDHRINFLCIQETHCLDETCLNPRSLWGNQRFQFEFSPSTGREGRSGGITSIWDPFFFSLSNLIKTTHYLITSGLINGVDSPCNILNLYAPQDQHAKQLVWDEITSHLSNTQGLWILLGDFNEVREPCERKNSVFNATSSQVFNDFIHQCELIEYTKNGHRFTYVADNGIKKSRINRILVSPSFMNTWPTAALTTLPRSLSDHRPLILSTSTLDFGPPPFRFFNSWLSKPGINEIIINTLNTGHYFGRLDQILSAKLKNLKAILKTWIRSQSSLENEEQTALTNQMITLDSIIDFWEYTDDELTLWTETKEQLQALEHSKTLDLHQKSKAKWVKSGDENTAYFHSFINSRLTKNRIQGLNINGHWFVDPPSIRQDALEFFTEKFTEPMQVRPQIVCQGLKTLSPVDANLLTAQFTLAEITKAVWDCGSDKAPGPDGFNFGFIKQY